MMPRWSTIRQFPRTNPPTLLHHPTLTRALSSRRFLGPTRLLDRIHLRVRSMDVVDSGTPGAFRATARALSVPLFPISPSDSSLGHYISRQLSHLAYLAARRSQQSHLLLLHCPHSCIFLRSNN